MIIVYVDYGKIIFVDKFFKFLGILDIFCGDIEERVMDLNDFEKECGIIIFVKNIVINWNDYCINIVDILGYVDFGGEVERVFLMVDLVLLVVDVFDGLML